MPTPCYISITGQTQGNITAGAFTADSVGNIYVQGHEDEMLVQEFLHNVTVPTDPQSGQPAGQRAHKPFIFTVALNKAVPLMYNALASGEMLPTTELHWWRTSVEGKQEHYFTTVRYLPESFEIPWNPNTRTEVSTLCISQFRYSAQIRPSSVVTKDYTFKRPGWAGRFDQEGQYQDYQRTQYEVYDYPGRFKGAHGQNFARWQMDGWRNNAEVARGTSRSPEIWPGRRIVLTGHPQANLNREWQVVASELHGEQPQAVPGRSGSGTTLNNHFAVIPADRTWRPQPLLKPLVDGPQSAVVTGPAGEEIFCDEHGRVRVKFNWDRYNPSNQDSSCWIRVAQAWAGTGFGNLAIPRVGQEVIVDFLNGDPDQPIIMGRTYHQENRTPGSLPGTKTQMTIRSKTYKGSGFNELKFDDATGKEQIYIHAQKNMNTEVLNNRTTDVINNHAEKIGNNQAITVTNNQIQNIGVNQIQTVGVNQVETVGSNQIIKVGSNQVEKVGIIRALTVGVAYQTTVTASRKMRTMSTATMNTAGWRRRRTASRKG